MPRPPEVGDRLTTTDFDEIMKATLKRRENFPDEDANVSLSLVMFNIGDRYSKVECIEQEWTGCKQDVGMNTEGLPSCPNGHPVSVTQSVTLGWVEVT